MASEPAGSQAPKESCSLEGVEPPPIVSTVDDPFIAIYGGPGACARRRSGLQECNVAERIAEDSDVWAPAHVDLETGQALAVGGGICLIAPGGAAECEGDPTAFFTAVANHNPRITDYIDGFGRPAVALLADGQLVQWSRGDPGFEVVGEGYGAVALNDHHTCAVRCDGSVECWGENVHGQLGRSAPGRKGAVDQPGGQFPRAKVEGITGAVDVAVGAEHTCALTKSGEVWCWGSGYQGNLGVAEGSVAAGERVRVPLPAGATRLVSYAWSGCASLATGDVYCWGTLPGTEEIVYEPTKFAVLGPSAGIVHALGGVCSLRTDGVIFCRGDFIAQFGP